MQLMIPPVSVFHKTFKVRITFFVIKVKYNLQKLLPRILIKMEMVIH